MAEREEMGWQGKAMMLKKNKYSMSNFDMKNWTKNMMFNIFNTDDGFWGKRKWSEISTVRRVKLVIGFMKREDYTDHDIMNVPMNHKAIELWIKLNRSSYEKSETLTQDQLKLWLSWRLSDLYNSDVGNWNAVAPWKDIGKVRRFKLIVSFLKRHEFKDHDIMNVPMNHKAIELWIKLNRSLYEE